MSFHMRASQASWPDSPWGRLLMDGMTVTMNNSELITHAKGWLSNYGDVWCHPDAMTDVSSSSNGMKKHRVTFDSTEDNAFCVHKPDHAMRF